MSSKTQSQFGAIAAWLRFGELQAQQIDCRPYSAEAFKSRLKGLRSLTLDEDPAEFVPKMQQTGTKQVWLYCPAARMALAPAGEWAKPPRCLFYHIAIVHVEFTIQDQRSTLVLPFS